MIGLGLVWPKASLLGVRGDLSFEVRPTVEGSPARTRLVVTNWLPVGAWALRLSLGRAGAFMGALINSGYVYVIGVFQVLGGLCLLIHPRFVSLGLLLLGPVIVNIVLYHIFMDPSGLPLAVIISVLALFLLWIYRYKFPAIFQP